MCPSVENAEEARGDILFLRTQVYRHNSGKFTCIMVM